MQDTGRPIADVLADLDRRRATEPDVHGARLFGLTYPSGRTDLEDLAHQVYERYLFGNALNPFKSPSSPRSKPKSWQWSGRSCTSRIRAAGP